MRFRLAMIVGAALGVSCFYSASAQIVPTPLGLLVRAGIFKPTSGTGSAVGSDWFTAGVEMDLFRLRLAGIDPIGGRITLSIDTYSRSGASSIPVLLNFSAKSDQLKYSFGAGVSIAKRPGFDTVTRFAYQFSLGYELPIPGVPILAEARFFGVSGMATALDGIALTLGIRL